MYPTPRQLAASTLSYRPPSAADRVRHARALDLLHDLLCALVPGVPQGRFDLIDDAIRLFYGRLFDLAAPDANFVVLDGDRPYPEGTEVIRALNRVRMCATRCAGARTPLPAWDEDLRPALRALELAVATAIVATPVPDPSEPTRAA